jgi:hypothetical protein
VTVDTSNAARRTSVRLGLEDEQLVEIVDGLAESQLVVIRGSTGLNDGDSVAPQAPVLADEGASHVAY